MYKLHGQEQNGTLPYDWDDGSLFANFGPRDVGFMPPAPVFITLVNAILHLPDNNFLAAGRNGATDATSNLFWVADRLGDVAIQASAGFLKTQSGNGGFSMVVESNGSWSLTFDGSGTTINHDANGDATQPPAPSPGLIQVNIPGTGAASYNGSGLPGPALLNGGLGYDTFQGGVGDYMIGGSGTLGGGLAGHGNCALYTASPGSVLVDMQNGHGYGGNAEGNVYANMNQARGSFFSNVLIGDSHGTDLKSGGNGSIMISTGGDGFELRPDGSGNLLISTVGGDRVVFDPTHGWALGDDNMMIGFNLMHGNTVDLTTLLSGSPIAVVNGPSVVSNFFTTSATGYNSATGTGNINDYVKIVDDAGGSRVLFSPTGNVRTAGVELVDLEFTHGLNVSSMYANHQILT